MTVSLRRDACCHLGLGRCGQPVEVILPEQIHSPFNHVDTLEFAIRYRAL